MSMVRRSPSRKTTMGTVTPAEGSTVPRAIRPLPYLPASDGAGREQKCGHGTQKIDA